LKNIRRSFYLLTIIVSALTFSRGYGQAFFGVKAGANVNKHSFDHEVYKRYYDTKFSPGYAGGLVFLYENKGRFGLYTEFLYSQKGKSVSVQHNADDYVTNVADYQYFDVPIMFRIKFEQPKFDWFLQLGPELNYWLGGKGVFEVYDPNRDEITSYEYKINFGETQGSSGYLNVEEGNRLQIGLALGGGFIWELENANYISLDLRFSLGNTYIGGYRASSIPNIGLVDNLEYTNNVLSVSAVYYFDILEKLRLSKNRYRKH
jgi:hypothetical protein